MPAYPCPQCGGRGKITVVRMVELTGGTKLIEDEMLCPTCEGKGWI